MQTFLFFIANDTWRECALHISDVKKKKNLIFEFLGWLSSRICYCIISMHSDANIQMSAINKQFPKSSASLINSHKFSKKIILFGKLFVGLFSIDKIKYCLKWGFQTMSEKKVLTWGLSFNLNILQLWETVRTYSNGHLLNYNV